MERKGDVEVREGILESAVEVLGRPRSAKEKERENFSGNWEWIDVLSCSMNRFERTFDLAGRAFWNYLPE